VASPGPRPVQPDRAGAAREQNRAGERAQRSERGHDSCHNPCQDRGRRAPRQPDRPSPRPDPLWFGVHSAQAGRPRKRMLGQATESAWKSYGKPGLIRAFSISITPAQTPVRAWRAPGLNLCNWRLNPLVSGPYTFASGPLQGPKAPVLARVLPSPAGARGRACLSGSARPSGPIDGPGLQPSWFPRRLTRRHRPGVALHLDSVPRGTSR
jgi:hypothetical protein